MLTIKIEYDNGADSGVTIQRSLAQWAYGAKAVEVAAQAEKMADEAVTAFVAAVMA